MEIQSLNEERGREIREKREQLGIDIRVLAEEVARAIPVTNMVKWLQEIEEGKQLPSWRLAFNLSLKLELSLPLMGEWLEANKVYAGPYTDFSNSPKPDGFRDLFEIHEQVLGEAPFEDFGEYICFQARRQGVTFRGLLDYLSARGRELGVGAGYLVNIVQGNRLPPWHLACKIVEYLGIPREDIGKWFSMYVPPIEEFRNCMRDVGYEEIPRAGETSLADRLLMHLSGPASPYIKELMDLIETKSADQRAKILAVVEKMLTALNQNKEDNKK